MISVVIPYAGHNEQREQALRYVTQRYGDLGYEVRVGVGDHLAWRKAIAVQDAIDRSSGDLLIISDADVWTDELQPAIDAVHDGAAWAVPYRQVWRLPQESSVRYMAGDRERLNTLETHQPMVGGGIVILHRDTYEDCPLDPRFLGWGGEDLAWGTALRVLHGPPARPEGRLWHFWHPSQPRRSRVRGSYENTMLAGRYLEVLEAADPQSEMRALIEEGRAWASNDSSSSRAPFSTRQPSPTRTTT